MKALDPAKVAAAVRRVREGGERPEVAAAACGIGVSSLRAALKVAAAAPPPPKSKTRRATKPVTAPRLKAKRGTLDEDLEIIGQQVDEIRQTIAQKLALVRAGDTAASHGLAALYAELSRLLKLRAELRPPERSDDDEERRWRADADAVLMQIEAGVKQAEQRIAAGRAA